MHKFNACNIIYSLYWQCIDAIRKEHAMNTVKWSPSGSLIVNYFVVMLQVVLL